MDQNIFKIVSDLRKQVQELEEALLLERETPRYTFSQLAEYMDAGLTLQAAEIKALLDELGDNIMPHEIADELNISLPQVLGNIDLLQELDLLGGTSMGFTTRLISSEDIDVPDLNPFEYRRAMNEFMGPTEPVSNTEDNIVEFKRRGIDIRNMSDEEMLDRMIQAYHRASEWPMRNRTNNARWADRFMAIAEALEMPSPQQYTGRFGSLAEAKQAADMLLNKRLLEGNETMDSSDVELVYEDVEVETMSETGVQAYLSLSDKLMTYEEE